MSRPGRNAGAGTLRAALLVALLAQAAAGAPQAVAAANRPWADIGRPATSAEIRAWDIDVRSDFKGLPEGSGSVSKGEAVWDEKCASCHGTFGESNEVFMPIVGGTTAQDIEAGRVANLRRPDFPQRTTLMKLSQLSSLWDYINRAMPWNAPKSLSVEEVYAVTAYILNLADIVPADFVLSNRNIVDVQQRLPNRDGMVLYDGLWRVDGKPDVQGDACMRDCAAGGVPGSPLPEYARNAHGNLLEQNRGVGPTRGADTTKPALQALVHPEPSAPSSGARASSAKPADLARDANCLACHAVAARTVGPSFRDVGAKYRGRPGAAELLVGRVKNGSRDVWGSIPMPPNSTIPDRDIRVIVKWVLDGAP